MSSRFTGDYYFLLIFIKNVLLKKLYYFGDLNIFKNTKE